MPRYIILLFLILSIPRSFVYGQIDTLSGKNIAIEVESKALMLNNIGTSEVRIDPAVDKYRLLDVNNLTDNPFLHAAVYGKIYITYSFKGKYQITLIPILEQRGWSYGVGDLKNNLVYPQIKFILQDTIHLCHKPMTIRIFGGNSSTDEFIYDLRLYNIDLNYLETVISFSGIKLAFLDVADIRWGIGNNVEELQRITFEKTMKIRKVKSFTNGIYISRISHFTGEFRKTKSAYPSVAYRSLISTHHGNIFNLSVDLALRGTPTAKCLASNISYSFVGERKKFSYSIRPGIRYYGSGYNDEHQIRGVIYREGGYPTYGNTTGRYLYPLENYYRPVSQWAFYTEYIMKSVFAFELTSSINFPFYRNFCTSLDLETISVFASSQYSKSSFSYIYYILEVKYQLPFSCKFGIKMTNKLMNLDTYYQTFYQTKDPYWGIFFSKEIDSSK